jgi:hypothetical protein
LADDVRSDIGPARIADVIKSADASAGRSEDRFAEALMLERRCAQI